MFLIRQNFRREGQRGLLFFLVSCSPLTPSSHSAPVPEKRESDRKTPANGDSQSEPTPVPTRPPTAPTVTPTPALEPNLESIQRDLVDRRCIGCHTDATSMNRFVDLRDLRALYTDQPPHDPPGIARKIIRVGCPDESMFFISLKNDQMPPAITDRLSRFEKETISEFILKLVPEQQRNCSEEPPDDL